MKNNQTKEAIIVLILLAIIIVLLAAKVINAINDRDTTYEYAVDGKIYQSSKCYEKPNGDIRCLKGNELVKVDNYYEVENGKK